MLKARPAGNKNLPIACGRTTLGDDLSYGVFEEATFQAEKAIELNGTDLAHADLGGSKLTVTAENNDVPNQNVSPLVGLPTLSPPPPPPSPTPPRLRRRLQRLRLRLRQPRPLCALMALARLGVPLSSPRPVLRARAAWR